MCLGFAARCSGLTNGGSGSPHTRLFAVTLGLATFHFCAGDEVALAQVRRMVQFQLGEPRLNLACISLRLRPGDGLSGALTRRLCGHALGQDFREILLCNQISSFHLVAFMDRNLGNAARVFG